MRKAKTAEGGLAERLRAFALGLPDTEESIACAGTTLEKKTVKVRKKAFLFLSNRNAMLKLAASLPAANQLAAAEPERYQVGTHGWTTIQFSGAKTLPIKLIEGWISESYSLFAPQARPRE